MKSLILIFALLISGTAIAACPTSVICAKDFVVDNDYSTGQVVEVFSNGRANVKYDTWGFRTADVKDLSKAIRCKDNLCMKDRVIRGSATGVVMAIYNNSKVHVKYDNYGWQWAHTTQLSKAVR